MGGGLSQHHRPGLQHAISYRRTTCPKSYRDLLKPEWKGKLGIESEDFDWFAQVVMDLGEARGLQLFRDIVAANGISVRKGHNLLANLVAAGEVPLALTVYGFLAEQSEAQRRAARLVRDSAGGRAHDGRRARAQRAASARGDAVLRFPDRGRPADSWPAASSSP